MAELDSLEVRIESNADKAAKSVEALANAMGKLGKALESIKSADKFVGAMGKVSEAIKGIDDATVGRVTNLASAMKNLSSVNVDKTVKNMDRLKQTIKDTAESRKDLNGSQANETTPFIPQLEETVEEAEQLKEVLQEIESTQKELSGMSKVEESSFSLDADGIKEAIEEANEVRNSIEGATRSEGSSIDLLSGIETELGNVTNAATIAAPKIIAVLKALGSFAWKELKQSLSEIGGAFKKVGSAAISSLGKVGGALKDATKDASAAFLKGIWNTSPIGTFTNAIGNAAKSLKTLTSSLMRIGMYRILRTVFKDITTSLDESIQALYKFDAGLGGSFAQTMDNITANTNGLKASIGTLAANIINLLSPAINAAISVVTALVDALSALFAILGGNVFYKAAASSQKFGDTMSAGGAAAKEWKNQLLGFDEINKLNDTNGGGGGGGGSSPGIEFEEIKELPDWLKEIQALLAADKWREAGFAIADHLNAVIGEWDAEAWGNRLGEKIQHGISLATGFFSNTKLFDTLGLKVAQAFNGIAKKIDAKELGELFARKLNASLHAVDAFVLEIRKGEYGKKIGEAVQTWFETIDSDKITATLSHTLGTILGFIREFIQSFSLKGAVKKLSETIEQSLEGLSTELENSTAIKELSNWVNEVDWETAAGNVARGVGKLGNAVIKKLAELRLGWILSRAFNSALTALQVFIDTFDFGNALKTMATSIRDFLVGCANGIEKFDLSSAITNLTTNVDYAEAISKLSEGAIKLINALTDKLKEFSNSENINKVQESVRQMFAGVDWAGLFGAIAELAVQWWIFKMRLKFAAGWGAIQGIFSSLFNSVFGDEAQRAAEKSAINVLSTLDMIENRLRQSADTQSQAMADAVEDYAFEMRNMTLEEIADFQAENEALTEAIEQLAAEYGLTSIKAAEAEDSINGTIEAAEAAKETFNGIQDATEGIKTAAEQVAVEKIDEAAVKTAELQQAMPETAQLIQDTIVETISEAEQNFQDAFTAMAQDVTDFKDSAVRTLDDMKLSIVNWRMHLEGEFETLKSSIQSLKDAWTSEWGSPYIPLPHFNISGIFSLWPPQVPSISVDWFAKGGVVDGATLIGAGEAGKEAIVPLEHNMEWVSAVAAQLNDESGSDGSDDVVNAIYAVAEMIISAISNNKGSNTATLNINGKEFARAIYNDMKTVTSERGISLVNA